MFDPNHPHGHITRYGRKAKILSTELTPETSVQGHTIVALVSLGDEGNHVLTFCPDGRRYNDRKTPSDLLNAPEPEKEAWVGFTQTGLCTQLFASEAALKKAWPTDIPRMIMVPGDTYLVPEGCP